jgi:hypothetical protein
MKNNVFPTYYYLYTGLLFFGSVLRDTFSFENAIEWLLFISLAWGIILSYRSRVVWFAFYYYILIIFYNPFFLVIHNMPNSNILDVLIGTSFFMMSLNWKRYIISEKVEE